MSEDLLSAAEAAELLGISESGTFKLLNRAVLTRVANGRGGQGHVGVVSRAEVERVAAQRARAAAEHEARMDARRQPKPPRTPDYQHEWLTPDDAGAMIGLTGQAIRKRCHKGTIPHRKVGAFYWIRADHARLAAHVRATDGPDNMAIALDGLD
ncbi:hypothetical protein [Nocardioides marmoraquaticus]